MPPIQVHIDDPISPKKEGEAQTPAQNLPYPPAKPGASAGPAPTAYLPNPQTPVSPTRTTNDLADYHPPPPQPGAVPVPPGQQVHIATPRNFPPPPKAGETTTMPPQMGIPPPQPVNLQSRGTSAYSPPERAGPKTVNFGAAPAPQQIHTGSHPPGYQQNLSAQEMSSSARASLDASDTRGNNFGMNLGLGATGGGDGSNDTAGQVWNTVKGWATTAGNTLAETEKEVWRRINKE